MFNHARTLLCNVVSNGFQADRPGEELIDESFRPVNLPSHLLTVRRLLFGANPDRDMLNFRVRQLLTLIHSCELVDLVTALDPRITYAFTDRPYYDQRVFLPKVSSQLTGLNEAVTGYVVGTAGTPDISGRMRLRWIVELLNGTTASVTPVGGLGSTVEYSVANGITTPIGLSGSSMSLLVRESSFADGEGPKFEITVLRKPQVDCGTLLATAELLGSEVLARLFQGTGDTWDLLRNCWQKHFSLTHRLGSLVLALIYQTESIRVA